MYYVFVQSGADDELLDSFPSLDAARACAAKAEAESEPVFDSGKGFGDAEPTFFIVEAEDDREAAERAGDGPYVSR